MAVYNAANTITECIQSILNQTFPDFKVIVLNDLSTDNTVELIKAFQSDKIEIVNFKKKGFINALNTGLGLCDTEYIVRMDSDDIMLTNKLEEQVRFMDANQHIVAAGSYVETFGKYKRRWTRFSTGTEQVKRNFFWFNSINNPSSIIRRKVIVENNILYKRPYAFIDGDKDYALAEDYKFWRDLLKVGNLTNIPKVLLRYRIHDAQAGIAKKRAQDAVARKIRREGLMDFIASYGINLSEIKTSAHKISLFNQLKTLQVKKKDKWHLVMSQYMLIQSTPELKFWRFLVLILTSNLMLDRNRLELLWKMIIVKVGVSKKIMI